MEEPKRDAKGRWLPGETGNAGGRPKGYRRMTEDLHRILVETPIGGELDAMFAALDIPPAVQSLIELAGDRQEAFMRVLVYRMMCGSWEALRQVAGRLDPIANQHELSGRDGGPITTAGLQVAGETPADAAQALYLSLINGGTPPDEQQDDPDRQGAAADGNGSGSPDPDPFC